MELYSFLANDPFVQKGRQKLLEKLLRKHHIDPTGIVQPPDPPKHAADQTGGMQGIGGGPSPMGAGGMVQ
jgi:hypothetical protein